MNKLKKLLLISLFLLQNTLLFSQNSGSELCRKVYNFLKKASMNPQTQSIVVNGENDFPYNIISHFEAKNSTENTRQKLIFVFQMEDVLNNKELLQNMSEFIRTSSLDFDVDFVFAYGENAIQQDILQNSIERTYGLNTYIDEIDTSNDYIAIIVDLDEEFYSVISSSGKYTSSSYYVAGFSNLFLKNTKNPVLPQNYISRLFRSGFTYDRQLSAFFDEGIQAIKLQLGHRENSNLLILQGALNLVKNGMSEPQDQHFYILRVFGHYFRFSELTIMIAVEIIIFICLLYFSLLFFINTQRKKIAWSSVKYVWYVVPVSFLICMFCFTTGRFTTMIFKVSGTDTAKMYINAIMQIGSSVFFSTLFYLITLLYNPYFHIKAIDYLIVISSFINQFIFLLVDISLFPLFFIVFIFSILCLSIKNNIIHIILLFLMIWSFIPIAHAVTSFATPALLQNILISKQLSSFYLSLTLYPLLLVYFRILAGIIRKQTKATSTILTGMSFSVFLIIFLTIYGFIRTQQIKKRFLKQDIQITQIAPENINLITGENKIFDDTIRTITITLPENVCECNVIIEGINKNPVLYTDNDYALISPTSIYFKIPQNPPSTLNFSYGCSDEKTSIKISAYFATAQENSYNVCTRNFTIGE